jgi:hypothetical protein
MVLVESKLSKIYTTIRFFKSIFVALCNFVLRVWKTALLVLFHTTMKLLTQQILADFRKVGNQMNEADPILLCKFFHPNSVRTRYPTEFDEESRIFFGYVIGIEDER